MERNSLPVFKQAYSPGIFIEKIWVHRENQSSDSQFSGGHFDKIIKSLCRSHVQLSLCNINITRYNTTTALYVAHMIQNNGYREG
jgi:hypothetical protein